MSSRQTVLGFGIGLLFAAGFLYAFPNEKPTPRVLTPQELQAAASEQHMVVLSEEEYQGLLQRAAAADQNAAEKTAAATSDETTSETGISEVAPAATDDSGKGTDGQAAVSSAPAESTTANSSEEQKQKAAPQPAKPTYRKTEDGVLVTITGGMTSTQIAELLATSGVIQDAASFLQQLVSAEKHRSIRAGTYHFANGSDVQEVIHRLTTLPER